ncbi:Cytochrome P450 [Penicillium concentricum]|uniref:Cytochrome P450 n=1 Tax=Penicillium concentricum TaxID=293559 RepID=A0A9W9USR1_9EURO|nr:Cytochrome P450 [Penicillium concentricum]KAJ5355962.1 Cytochrome P450 [Penicillium concentricum]
MIVDLLISITHSSIFRIIIALALSTFLYEAIRGPRLYPGFPLVGVDTKDGYRRGLTKAREEWAAQGKQIIEQGMKQANIRITHFYFGPKLVLPNRFVDEIRNHPDFHFGKAISADFFGSYPGFQPFTVDSSSQVLVDTVKGRLTQSLSEYTTPGSTSKSILIMFAHDLDLIVEELADETNKAVDKLFGNPEKYALDAFIAARALRQWPFALRPIIHWFLPECRKLRATLGEARRILKSVIEKRRHENRERRDAGQGPSKVADTIGWMDEAAKGKAYDVAVAQLGLSLAAIHTTTEMVSGLISDLCANPEYFEPLREEIASAVADKGWSKKALQDLKLMDSAMKESQRHHFGDIAAMHRMTINPVTLSDGTRIPEGTLTMVGINQTDNADIFPESHKYKAKRFLNMRQKPGQEHRWQFVSTSPEHLAFGHGKHACPGRFFAANEIKVVLIFLLMNYDWKFTAEGCKVDKSFGQETDTDPTAKAMIRRRKLGVTM